MKPCFSLSGTLLAAAILALPVLILPVLILTAAPAWAQVRVDGRELPDPMAADDPLRQFYMDIPLEELPNYRELMRETVWTLGEHAQDTAPRFKVLMRHGLGLFTKSERETQLEDALLDFDALDSPTRLPEGALMRRLVRALDGVMVEGLYCRPRSASRAFLDRLRGEGLRLFTIETCADEQAARRAAEQGREEGVTTIVGVDPERRFDSIPRFRPPGENPDHITSLGDVRNGLLLLDTRPFASIEDWVMALEQTNHDLIVIDAFHHGRTAITFDHVRRLRYKALGARRLVMARMNVAMAEDVRYYWQREWRPGAPTWLEWPLDADASRYRVRYWEPGWRSIIGITFQGLIDYGFDGVLLEGADAFSAFEELTPLDQYGIQ